MLKYISISTSSRVRTLVCGLVFFSLSLIGNTLVSADPVNESRASLNVSQDEINKLPAGRSFSDLATPSFDRLNLGITYKYDPSWNTGINPYQWKVSANYSYKESNPAENNSCPAGYTFGLCGTNCGFGSYCDMKPGPCWRCVSVERGNLDSAFSLSGGGITGEKSCGDFPGYAENCLYCNLQGQECIRERPPGAPFSCSKCVGCPRGTGTWRQCVYGCEEMEDGVCVFDFETKDGVDCYYCDDPYDCEEVDQVCSCLHCPLGTRCVPGTVAYDEYDFPHRCYECLGNSIIGFRTDYIYRTPFIETPQIRYILGKKVQDGPGFEPTSIMSLAATEGVAPDAGQSQANLAALSKAFNASTGTKGTMQELSGQIMESLKKTRKFSDDCFKEMTVSQPQQIPPQENKSKKSDDKSGPAFGEDGSQDYILNGPILACGKIGDEDMLAVYDANGVLMGSSTRKELNDDPELLNIYLAMAERSNQEIPAISKRALMIQQKDAQLISPPESAAEGPDDQLYQFEKGKKKKGLLGGLLGGGGDAPGGISLGTGLFDIGESKEEVKDQWGLAMIGFLPFENPKSAWQAINGNNRNIVVAVIDSGFDFSHPDAPANLWYNRGEILNNKIDDDGNGYVDDIYGWNFLNENTDLTDYNGHGTFVAGIIAAKRNNEIGIAGINPGAVIMPLKVANEEGETQSLAVFRAVHYAVNNGARVINISLGARGISQLEQSALNYAYAHGAFVAVASGNNGLYIEELGPASAKRAFTVGAVNMQGERSTFSSWGPNNAIMAPGELIYSIRSKDSMGKRPIQDPFARLYHAQSGTSFSTPMVAATASLLLAKNPKLTGAEVENILVTTAKDMDVKGWDDSTGAGLLDAAAAFNSPKPAALNVKITQLRLVYNDRDKISAVDVFATVDGDVKNFELGVGKGKRAGSFKTVAGPFTKSAREQWIARIDAQEDLRGSKEWIVQVSATDNTGHSQTAQALLQLTKNPAR